MHFGVTTKCNGGKHDNNELCKKIAKLKHKRAKLLGYKNYADLVHELATRFNDQKTPETCQRLFYRRALNNRECTGVWIGFEEVEL